MALIDIDGALITGYINIGLGLSTAYEGEEFTPPTDGSDWAAVFILPATSEPTSMGVGGMDEHTGIMQVDFSTKHGTGRATLLGYVQSMRDEFVVGKGYTRNSQAVEITSVERSPVREIDGWMRVSVSVNWLARTIRPAI